RSARDELAQTHASIKALQSSQENGLEQLRTEIADLKDAVAVAEEARATAEKQRDETNAKLAEANRQINAVEQQRDEALAQLKAGSETEQHPQALFAENGDLKLKLANLEKNAPANANSTNVEELVGVKQEVTQLQQQLAESQKQRGDGPTDERERTPAKHRGTGTGGRSASGGSKKIDAGGAGQIKNQI